MPREIIWQFAKITLLGLLTILLLVRIWQADASEQRWLDAQVAVGSLEEKVDALSGKVDGVNETLQAGVPTRSAGPGTDAVRSGGEGVDPRTLPYWKTDDNILVSMDNEPRPPADAPRGGILRYFTRSNPKSLNVHTTNDAELQERITAPVYNYIADQSKYNPDEFSPAFCNRVTANADFTEFTCYVRKGMYWHKPYLTSEQKRGNLAWLDKLPPQEATAEDIKFTFDTTGDPLSQCGNLQSYLKDLESVEVLDRYTIRIRWKRSLYYNKGTTLNLLYIYPKFIFTRDANGKELPEDQIAITYPQHWFNNMMCGTGPFQFAGFESNQIVKLRRNPNWWGPFRPALDGIDINILQDPSVRLAMFKNGDLDVLHSTSADYNAEILSGGKGSIKELIEQGKVTLVRHEMFSYFFVGWNLRHKALRERLVRRALAHLYPKERIIRDVQYGLAAAHDSPVHRFENQYDKNLEQFPFSVERAQEILDEAGWKTNSKGIREKVVEGERIELRFKLLYPSQNPASRDATQLMIKSAGQAGIIIEPFPRDWMVMIQNLNDKQFDACMLGWGNSWDSDPTQIWHSDSAKSAKGSNMVSYIKPELDEIIESLKTEFDPAKRLVLWKEFQRIIVDDQPYVFTFIGVRPWFVWNRMGNHYFAKLRPQDWFLPWFIKK